MIIPARDAAATLPDALGGLADQTFAGEVEVIVVNDASRDATPELAAAHGATVLTGAGEGPAAARNLGAAFARAPVLAFLDADCRPAPGWLSAGLRGMAGADLLQGAVRPPSDAPIGPFDRTLWVLREVGLYETANVFVRRDLFEALDGFESWLRPRRGIELGEDLWFGWRARRAGARTEFAGDALVFHAVFPRGPVAYAGEAARLRFFPAIARRVPELREHFFHRRVFLSRRSAAFDLALAGLAVSAGRRSALPLVATAPWARLAWRHAHRAGRRRLPVVLAADIAADAIGAVALAAGSVRARSPLF